MNKIIILALLTFVTCSTATYSQSFGFSSVHCGSVGMDAMIQLPSGNFLVANNGGDSAQQHANGCIYKLDKDMNVIWKKYHFGGSASDFFTGIKYYRNGKVVVVGYTSSSDGDLSNTQWPNGQNNIWVAIIDTNGNLLHNTTYGYGSSTGVHDVDCAANGDIYIAGSSIATQGDFAGLNNQFLTSNIYVAKLDSQLNKKTFRVLQGSQEDDMIRLVVVNENAIMLAMNAESTDDDYVGNSPIPNSKNMMAMIDSNLNFKWQKRYGCNFHIPVQLLYDSSTATAYYISTTTCKTGTCLDTNYSYFNEYGYQYTWILKLDTLGDIKYSRIYGGFHKILNSRPSVSPHRAVLSDGFLYVMQGAEGTDTYDLGSDSAAFWLIKLDIAKGAMVARQRLGIQNLWALWALGSFIKTPEPGTFIFPGRSRSTWSTLNPLNCVVDTILPSNKQSYHIFKITEWPSRVEPTAAAAKTISIYPNPVGSELCVELAELTGQDYVIVADQQGRIRSKHTIYEKLTKLAMSNYAAGIYVVQVHQNGTRYSKQIIIK